MPLETWSARSSSSGGGGGPALRVRSAQKGIFRKEGEFWTLGYGGTTFSLRDTKGLGYLTHLLRHPTVEFHVLDLAGGIAGQRDDDEGGQATQGLPRGEEALEQAGIQIGSLGDGGEMLDDQAKAEYRRRLSELREELDEAKELGNADRAEQLEDEIDALTRELSRAVAIDTFLHHGWRLAHDYLRVARFASLARDYTDHRSLRDCATAWTGQ